MEQSKKKSIGRPKKLYKSKIRSFRFSETTMGFFKYLNDQELNANEYIKRLIFSTQEYQDYLRKQADDKNQPSLF